MTTFTFARLLFTAGFVASRLAQAQAPAVDWAANGRAAIVERLAERPIESKAKNIILFIGDGMGVTTITAGRIYAGQRAGGLGEDHVLAMDRLPYSALVKTYNTDAQVADSAGTATALVTGEKTRIGVVGIDQDQPRGLCKGASDHILTSLIETAEERGLSTGIVSTTRLTHATPASGFAHSPDRDWESDSDLSPEAVENACSDIARQFIDFDKGDGIEVTLAGGRRAFLPATSPDPEYPDQIGQRQDGRNLVAEWKSKTGGDFVWNQAQFEALPKGGTKPVLGLFQPSHMQYEADRAKDSAGEPSLAAMTRYALERLQHSDKGYVLLVEGGRIDHAHHAANAYRALSDTAAFDDAVAVALDQTSPEDTLILVTADHSHTLTIAGYPVRGNPILGLSKGLGTLPGTPRPALDGKPYTTLGYANGPGAIQGERARLTEELVQSADFRQQSAVPLGSETHGGEDVALFTRGPWAHLARGVMEQSTVYHLMTHALGWAEE